MPVSGVRLVLMADLNSAWDCIMVRRAASSIRRLVWEVPITSQRYLNTVLIRIVEGQIFRSSSSDHSKPFWSVTFPAGHLLLEALGGVPVVDVGQGVLPGVGEQGGGVQRVGVQHGLDTWDGGDMR